MHREFKAVLTLAFLLTGAPALAQNAQVLERLKAADAAAPAPARAELTAKIVEAAAKRAAAGKGCAPSAIRIDRVDPLTGAGGIFAAVVQGQMRNAWSVMAFEQGCSDPDPMRYIVLQRPDASLVVAPVNRGYAIANPTIMRDTSANAGLVAFRTVQAADAGCKGDGMDMERTRIDRQDPGLGPDVYGVRYTGGWREIWTFGVCGRRVEVPVTFTADGDGGAYSNIEGGSARILPAASK
jgi:hypothetical protein